MVQSVPPAASVMGITPGDELIHLKEQYSRRSSVDPAQSEHSRTRPVPPSKSKLSKPRPNSCPVSWLQGQGGREWTPRTLEKFPMKYDRPMTIRSMREHRSARHLSTQLTAVSGSEFATSSVYHKRMFEDVLSKARRHGGDGGEEEGGGGGRNERGGSDILTKPRAYSSPPKIAITFNGPQSDRALGTPENSYQLPRLGPGGTNSPRVPSYAIFNDTCSQRRHSTQQQPLGAESGPTFQGSPVYNYRAKVLNEVRMRPRSETQTQYDHARAMATPDIRETLQKSNSSYRVVVPSESEGSDNNMFSLNPYENFFLVPVEVEETQPVTSKASGVGNVKSAWDVSGGRKTTVPMEIGEVEVVKDPTSHENEIEIPAIMVGESGNVDDDERVVPGEKEGNENVPDTPVQDPTEPVQDILNSPVAPPTVASPRPKTERKPMGRRRSSAVKIRHWTDDVTVSSIASHTSSSKIPDEPANQTLQAKKPANETNRRQSRDTKEANQSGAVAATRKSNGKVNGNEHSRENSAVVGDDVTLEEESLEYVLPDFICPSSEDKSREARTKDWLRLSTFTWASKNVPLT